MVKALTDKFVLEKTNDEHRLDASFKCTQNSITGKIFSQISKNETGVNFDKHSNLNNFKDSMS